MDLDELTLELEDKLNLVQPGQTAVDEESWLFVPDGTNNKTAEEQQNLDKWLKGAVEKVDFRTRSALSRRLDKKKRKADREKRLRNNNAESALSRIEEVSSESGPMSDREQRVRPREKENMAARKAISEASVCSDDYDEEEEVVEDEDDEEEYFDAPSTPKKTPQLQTANNNNNNRYSANNKQTTQPTRKLRLGSVDGVGGQTPPRMNTANNNNIYGTVGRSATKPTTRKRIQQKQAQEEEQEVAIEVPMEWRDLGDIERRAREQEKELQMELMRNRQARLGATEQHHSARGGGGGATMNRPRPDSASSSTSSGMSGGTAPPSSGTRQRQQQKQLATSKSVDFRSSSGHIADQSSSVASSRSNEGSLADLSATSDNLNQPPNSRLPLPRRPTIPGKTGIPLPAPKRTAKLTTAKRTSSSSAPCHDDQQLDDEEYF